MVRPRSRLAPLLLLTLLVLTTSCSESPPPSPSEAESVAEPIPQRTDNSRWNAHIQAAPNGWVSANAPLVVEFSHPVNSDAPPGQSVESVVAVEPNLSLTASFVSDRRLRLTPEVPLQRDVQYRFRVFPQKLAGVAENLAPYEFRVRAYQQDFGVALHGLAISDDSDTVSLSGTLTLNDADLERNVKQVVTVERDGRALPITWQHTDPTTHRFTVNNIRRGDQTSQITVRWNGRTIAVEKQGSRTLAIPPLQSFEVVGANSSSGRDQYISVIFSQPLDRRQSFAGLITVDDQAPRNVRVDGNQLRVYPQNSVSGSVDLAVLPGIRSTRRQRLDAAFNHRLTFLQEKPGVRFKSKAHILPADSKVIVPIEAVNVDAVRITAHRLPNQNLGQFLQARNLQYNRFDRSTTTSLWRKTFRLPEIPREQWRTFQLDLTEYMEQFGDDLLALELQIDRSHSILDCGTERPAVEDIQPGDGPWPTVFNQSQPDWVNRYYRSSGRYTWRDRDNPCKEQYYLSYYNNPTRDFRYFHHSNLGLIAKMGVDRNMTLVATEIDTALPRSGVEITAYNFQHQPVGRVATGADGMAQLTPVSAPHYLMARAGNDLGFLRLPRNEALSTNVFDTGGEQAQSGIKGFFYGERGVWRPGDDIFLTFIVQDRSGQFPTAHPLTLDFFDPKGNKHNSITHTDPVNGFYAFQLSAPENALTGNWRAVIRYGGQYFDKVVPVEAIVPNRLKIELDFLDNGESVNELAGKPGTRFNIDFFSQWLNGARAADLTADLEMNMRPTTTRIGGYESYVFDDPAREFQAQPRKVFEGQLDGDGRATIDLTPQVSNAPGKLQLNFTARVFERSGNFSTQYRSVSYLPFEQLVGLNIPKGNGWNNAIARDEDHNIGFVTLNADGEPQANVGLELSIYRVDWRWWWDRGEDNLQNYISSQYNRRVVQTELSTNNDGRANWQLNGDEFRWGRYLVRVCQRDGRHCAGEVVYLGWSYNQQTNPAGETQLMLATDKDRYQVGETAYLTLPQLAQNDSPGHGKLLLSLESGTGIVRQQWIESELDDGRYALPVTADMAPNVYAHVTLLQPYDGKNNDSPMRLYGVVPIHVEDPASRLSPRLSVPDEVRPESILDVAVTEQNGAPMTYTLAVVDEGLLGITNFATPDPHGAMYRREALGVLSWDMYDLVARQPGMEMDRLLTIGGSDSEGDGEGRRRERRFPPVVEFLGPFELGAGESAQHRIQLPEYMGAVRVTAVAGNPQRRNSQANGNDNRLGAYGSTSQSVRVTQPLTLLATLPRVLGPNERLDLPVNVFVNNDELRDVRVEIVEAENFLLEETTQSRRFDQAGDKIVSFPLVTSNTVGSGSVTVRATSDGEVAEQTINIPIRTANLPQTVSQSRVIQPGQTTELRVTPNGMINTNRAYVELSRVPQLNLERRMQYLIRYPHGCLEQTISRAFPQLYLPSLTQLSGDQQADLEYYVNEALAKLASFQNADGGFDYWPGGRGYSNSWANNFAGHFMLEAKRLGYFVPANIHDRWIADLRRRVRDMFNNTRNGYESSSAYALFNLVLANQADFNAMNRLKERLQSLHRRRAENANYRLARWLLAAAYAKAGVNDAAQNLMAMDRNTPFDYQHAGYSYGSSLRDRALLSVVYHALGNETQAWQQAEIVAEQLSQGRWYSTQTTAWGLMALSRYGERNDLQQGHAVSWRVNGGDWENLSIVAPVFKQTLANPSAAPITVAVRNDGSRPLYAMLGNRGTPANQSEVARSQGVGLDVAFTDLNGNPLNVEQLPQGRDFRARVTVRRAETGRRLENLALTMIVPSGWQISNQRLQGQTLPEGVEHQDIRDDRVISYFTLGNYYYYHRNNRDEVTIDVTLNASYTGRFYLPGWRVESMYDRDIGASTTGRWVTVNGQQSTVAR